MNIDDPRWSRLVGGYRIPYDPRKALRALQQGGEIENAWKELWNELHHQGDVGEASYAAVPHLVRIHAARGVPDWNTYALAVIIEDARRQGRNPALPDYLREDYEGAWRELLELGLRELADAKETTLVTSIIGAIAMGKGLFVLGRLAVMFTEDELQEMIDGK